MGEKISSGCLSIGVKETTDVPGVGTELADTLALDRVRDLVCVVEGVTCAFSIAKGFPNVGCVETLGRYGL